MKKNILIGFIIGVISTICFFFLSGDVQIETSFQFGDDSVQEVQIDAE